MENFEFLGLLDRYENVIASVGYEFIEQHVTESCKGRWDKTILEDLRIWMSNRVVPWMLQVYARGASNRTSSLILLYRVLRPPPLAEEARAMLQGVGPCFDFHINKTLCDLRFVIVV